MSAIWPSIDTAIRVQKMTSPLIYFLAPYGQDNNVSKTKQQILFSKFKSQIFLKYVIHQCACHIPTVHTWIYLVAQYLHLGGF